MHAIEVSCLVDRTHCYADNWHSHNEALAHNSYELMRSVMTLQARLHQTESDAE